MRYILIIVSALLIYSPAKAERFEYSSFPGIEIPRNDSIGVWDSIFVDQAIQINDINVFVGINVYWFLDSFEIPVYSPWTDSVYLVNRSDNSDSLNIWFDTDAIEAGQGELEDYNGHIAIGWWKLNPRNVFGGGNNYTFSTWGIEIYGDLQSGAEGEGETVFEFGLNIAYPNPFNASAIINYSLAEECRVAIAIFNVLGQKVTTLIDGNRPAGMHSITWDASDYPSGAYFYRMEAGDFKDTKKMILLK